MARPYRLPRAIVALSFLAAPAAWAATDGPATPTRVGKHAGFGRLVFDLPSHASFNLVTEGDRLLVVFQGAGPVATPAGLPRNVLSVQTGTDTATLVLAPGARARSARLGSRLVIDVLNPARPDPAHGSHSIAIAEPKPQTVRAAAAVPDTVAPDANVGEHGAPLGHSSRAPRAVDLPTAGPSSPPVSPPPAEARQLPAPILPNDRFAAAPVLPVAQEPLPPPTPPAQPVREPMPVSTTTSAPPLRQPSNPPATAATHPSTFLIRADADVGAAAFRRGDKALVVFDRRIAPSLALADATWHPGPVSMTLMLPLSPAGALRLTRVNAGWTVETVEEAPPARLAPVPNALGTTLPMVRPGRSVAILDPLTGGTLLVGTSLVPNEAAAIADLRHASDFTLLPTWLGIAVEPLSDRIELRPTPAGFVLNGEPIAQAPSANAGTRRFDFPDQPPQALFNRLRAQLAGAANALPRARTRERVAAVQSMIALGLGVEAHAITRLIASEDPQAATDADIVGLNAIAAMAAGRLEAAAGLDDPRLDGDEDILLWRGLRDRQLRRDTAPAHDLGKHAALALAYPPSLQRLVWPAVAEAAVESGTVPAGATLPPLALAIKLERDGKVDEALAAYIAIVAGPDRLEQVRAAAKSAELRLSSGAISPTQASDEFERLAFAWRGDTREAALRIRSAELRSVAGDWKAALDGLKQVGQLFPDQRQAAHAQQAIVLQSMLAADGGAMSPLDLVLLAAEYADGVPEGPEGGALARLLAEKLLALDLPARAIPLLQGLMRAAPAGEPRAEFGVRLAQLLLDGSDPDGAATALDASAGAEVSPGLRESRGLLLARIRAAKGNTAEAVAGLLEVGTESADDLRATLLAAVHDWTGSLNALADLAAKRVPHEGPLTDAAQEVLLRQATAAAQASDVAALRMLASSAPRLTGPRADLFRILTADPVKTAADLPRTARELTLARALPGQLQAIGMR